MHLHWQSRQVLEGPRNGETEMQVDRRGVLVMPQWCGHFATFWSYNLGGQNRRSIENPFHYIDDANSFDDSEELVLYPPYQEL